MTDHQAMESINAVLEDYYRGRISDRETLTRITRIAGANLIKHQESK